LNPGAIVKARRFSAIADANPIRGSRGNDGWATGPVAQTIDLKVERQSAVVFGVYATTLSVPGQCMRVGEIAAVRCDNTGLAPANPVRKGNDNA